MAIFWSLYSRITMSVVPRMIFLIFVGLSAPRILVVVVVVVVLASGSETSEEGHESRGRPNEFLSPCWTDERSIWNDLVMGCETSGEGHESRVRPNDILSSCWTDGRAIWNDLAMGCETTAEYCSQFRTIEKVK